MNPKLLLVKCRKLLAAVSLVMTLVPFVGYAQEKSVTGTVVSSDDNSAVPGVSILVKGTSTGTVTDADGKFSINVPEGSILQFSYIGYARKEVLVGAESVLTISMDPDITQLQDVVVVGYAEQKRVNLTGSLSTLDMSIKENTPTTNVSQALHGVAGLWVNQPGGQPGNDGASIRIRGVGTTNSSSPLVLVNGIEFDMNQINPADIETVTVLKDASAAIYGSRAANGVILITTKTGKKGHSEINYSFSHGVQQPTMMPDVVWDPIQYMQMRNQAMTNEGSAITYSEAQIQEYRDGMAVNPYAYPDINWFDYILKKGHLQQHNLRFSGGSEKMTYNLSLGYMDQDGVLKYSNHANRYMINVDVTGNITERLKIGGNINGNFRKYTEMQRGISYYFNRFMRVLPIFSPYLENGTYGNAVFATPGRNAVENPEMLLKEGSRENVSQRILTKVFAEYKLPFDLTYNITFGVDKVDGYVREFIPYMTTYNPKTGVPYLYNQIPYSYSDDDNDMNTSVYQTLTWNKTFASAHNVTAMVGTSYTKFDNSGFSGKIEGYFDNELSDLSVGSVNPVVTGNVTDERLASYFGRLNYNFNEKYLLEGTFRLDGSSRFAPGHRWGFYPAVSAGWRLDQESFMANASFINILKLRASWGEMGNLDRESGLYRYLKTVNLGQDYTFGNAVVPGAAITGYADEDISWEMTTSYNAGIDVDAWNGLVSLSVDVFKKRTTDVLRSVNIPAQVGNLSAPQRNIGTIDNTGFEIILTHRRTIQDFRYEVSGNVTYVKNEVVDVDGQEQITGVRIIKEGYPIDSYYLYRADGIYQTQEEVDNSAKLTTAVKPGYLKYWDKNENDRIEGGDRIITGSSIPKYNYSFTLSAGYKRLNLTAFFQGVEGVDIYPTANLAFPFNNGAGVAKEWATDSWTPGRTDAKLPILTSATGATENFAASTFWLKDASYLRLKNIQMSYDLPEKWVSKVSMTKLSVFVNGENLVTFSDYDQFDPEKNITNNTLYEYPSLKTYSIGLNATF